MLRIGIEDLKAHLDKIILERLKRFCWKRLISFRLKGAGVSGYAGGAKNEAALRLPFFQTSDGLFGTNPEEINLRDDHSALLFG